MIKEVVQNHTMADDWISAILHPKGVKFSAVIVNKVTKCEVSKPVLGSSMLTVCMSVGFAMITFFVWKPIGAVGGSGHIMPLLGMEAILRMVRIMIRRRIRGGRHRRRSGHGHVGGGTRQLPT